MDTTNAVWNSSFYILNIYICIRSGQWWNQSASNLNNQSEARKEGALTNKRVGKCHQSTDCHLSPPLTMGPGISDRQLTPRHNTEGQGWALMMIQLQYIFYIHYYCISVNIASYNYQWGNGNQNKQFIKQGLWWFMVWKSFKITILMLCDQSLCWYSRANSNGLTHSFGSSPRVNSLSQDPNTNI